MTDIQSSPHESSHGAPKRRAEPTQDARMVTALVQLRQALVTANLPLDSVEHPVDELRATRSEIIDQLEDYVIPRLTTLEAPMLVVVGGSTGAGKSTLVNSIIGERVTTPGVLRPTTRSPVIAHHPDDAQWFGQDRLLPDLRRVGHATDAPDCVQLVATESVPVGLAILDAPDVDSVEERNRELAAQLLAAADLWLFVTSAARYADQVPWAYLKQAAERSTAVAVVLDRTPEESVQTVATHLARMLASRGLKDSPLFTVAEGKVDDDGLLPEQHVDEIRDWLTRLADDGEARGVIVRQTLDGAIRSLTRRIYPVADAAAQQADLLGGLAAGLDRVFGEAEAGLVADVSGGAALDGEVRAGWNEYAGSGELLRSLDSKVGGLRDRLVNTLKGKPQQADRLSAAIEAALEALVLQRAEAASSAVVAAWHADPAGAGFLTARDTAGGAGLDRSARDLRLRAERAVRDWQDAVIELVRSEGATLRTTARFLAFGVNGLAVTTMVVALAPDDDPAGRTGRTILDAVFGAEVAARLLERAGQGLGRRLTPLLHQESERYRGLLGGLVVDPEAPARLRDAARRVDDLRYEAAKMNP